MSKYSHSKDFPTGGGYTSQAPAGPLPAAGLRYGPPPSSFMGRKERFMPDFDEDAYLLACHDAGVQDDAIALALPHRTFTAIRLRRLSLVAERESNPHRGQAKNRDCLMCHRPFHSHHFGERVCRSCKNTQAWQDGNDEPMTVHR